TSASRSTDELTARQRCQLLHRPGEGVRDSLWCWDGRAIPRDDLRLIRKDLTATRIHEHLHPLHIVVSVRRVVAECFNAREVLDATTGGVQEWLVNAAVMGVPMHESDHLPEGKHLTGSRLRAEVRPLKLAARSL